MTVVVQNESGVTQASATVEQTVTLAPGANSGPLNFTKQVAVFGGWKVYGQVFIDRMSPQPAVAIAVSQLQSYTEPASLGVELIGFGPGVAGIGIGGLTGASEYGVLEDGV